MNNVVVANIGRFFGLVVLQVLLFKYINIEISGFPYVHFLVYPLFIMLLPLNMRRTIVLLISFFTGLFVDMFYDSPGVHTAACVFMGYGRGIIIDFLEPFGGYPKISAPSPQNLGFNWFLVYSSMLLTIFLFAYFSVEAFSFVYFFDIVMNTIFSFLASMGLIWLFIMIFRPKN